MEQSSRKDLKIAFNMTFMQLGWSTWMIGIVLLLFISLQVFVDFKILLNDEEAAFQGFIHFIENPYKIFMLVVGILSVPKFLSWFVKTGITRKDYFKGNVIAALALSAIFMMIAVIIAGIEQLVSPVSFVTYLGEGASWFLIFLVYTLNLFVYYLAGWLIGAGYYRYSGWGLVLYIPGALTLIFMMDLLWSGELETPLHRLFSLHQLLSLSVPENLSIFIPFGVSFVLIAISLWTIRATIKRVRVKL
ncbi:hypothetical protein KP77_11670 [Jeotgalibacillus alimentarius]|uniref:Uncharacterized protein n=1 Tax=Jeotgalibacillus alimentarius TaxID=135826 RepID=A0A0C2RN22_9BACL|nr:hypothetical protein [Jeotgalibacillus alimentarius]KIL51655.1 hypothetical protein KP77_11670 [Jeotgalibacillus alimentarius]